MTARTQVWMLGACMGVLLGSTSALLSVIERIVWFWAVPVLAAGSVVFLLAFLGKGAHSR